MTSRYLTTTPIVYSTLIGMQLRKTHTAIWIYRVYLTSRPSNKGVGTNRTDSGYPLLDRFVPRRFRPGDLPSQNGGGFRRRFWRMRDTGWWQPEIWQTHQLMMVDIPLFTGILAPSKRWLGMGILNHHSCCSRFLLGGEMQTLFGMHGLFLIREVIGFDVLRGGWQDGNEQIETLYGGKGCVATCEGGNVGCFWFSSCDLQ